MLTQRTNTSPSLLLSAKKGDRKKIELEQKTKNARKECPYELYAWTLRRVPDEALYFQYLQELHLSNSNRNANKITPSEANSVRTRKLWSDIVTSTYAENQQYIKEYNIKATVMKRLKTISSSNEEHLYENCLRYIKDHSVIVLSFDPLFLKGGLKEFQLLNVWEKDNRKRSSY